MFSFVFFFPAFLLFASVRFVAKSGVLRDEVCRMPSCAFIRRTLGQDSGKNSCRSSSCHHTKSAHRNLRRFRHVCLVSGHACLQQPALHLQSRARLCTYTRLYVRGTRTSCIVLTELASFPPRSRSAQVGTGNVQPGVHFPPAPLRPACPRSAPTLPA